MIRAKLPSVNVVLSDGTVLTVDMLGGDKLAHALARGHCPIDQAAVYRSHAGLLILASIDRTHHGTLLHLSVSYCNRAPSWPELKRVKEAFFGHQRDAMLVLPRASDYVNIHSYCFHLWEMPVQWGIR